MEIAFTPKALSQLDYWKQTGNEAILWRIRALLESIAQSPFSGIGKPELLNISWRVFGRDALTTNID